MKSTVIAVFLTATLTTTSIAQAPAEVSPERAAVLANDRAYEAAYAKADVKALADFFTEDAEYTAEDGRTFTGREAIEGSLRAAFRANKGATLNIGVNSVRILSPEVVLEKGTTRVNSKEGESVTSAYSALHLKKNGKWKIGQLVESPLPEATAQDHLSELDWLVGEWEEADKANDLTVRSQYGWARGGNFLTRNVTVKKGGETTLEGWQIIGWDPVDETIHSWTFDGEGGFSEGRWTRDGDRWLVREIGIAPDGSRTTADATISKLSGDRYAWEAANRTLDGEPQPAIARIEINRVKGN